jgi:hypothetical protein
MNCKETARLLSESKDRPIPFFQRLGMRFHVMMCRMCHVYERQMMVVSRTCREAGDVSASKCPGELPADCRERIKDAMKKQT